MKKFVFKYPPVVWALLIAVSLIFAAAVTINVYDAIRLAEESTSRAVFAWIIAVLSAIMFTVALSVLFYGRYIIKDGFLYCRLGFFRSKTDVKTIFQITEFKANKKLVMYIVPEKYSVAVIDQSKYAEFFAALKEINPALSYTVVSADDLKDEN
ncbi:MAG: hypothetical protein IJU83_03620 [Clostridia bacterium]|nr:hypothetical protein [Clostridia bacterium]